MITLTIIFEAMHAKQDSSKSITKELIIEANLRSFYEPLKNIVVTKLSLANK